MYPNQIIRNWRIHSLLGEGGMGQVWLAQNQTVGNWAAIKVLFSQMTGEPKFRERFFAEATNQAKLRHPHIASVQDFFEENGTYYLILEYLEGGTIEDRLSRQSGWLPEQEVLIWAKQILQALEYAHATGVIHRDIKTSNIMLDGHGHAKLTDFGIAIEVGAERKTATGQAPLGTAHYMSPEQIRTPKEIDRRADIYSFGVLLYEMLVGRLPFDSENDFELKRMQVNTPPPPLRSLNPSISSELESIVLKALAKERGDRFADCKTFRQAIEDYEHLPVKVPSRQPTIIEPVPPPPPPVPAPLPPSASMNPLGVVIACTVAVILSLMGYSWLNGSSRTGQPVSTSSSVATDPLESEIEGALSRKDFCAVQNKMNQAKGTPIWEKLKARVTDESKNYGMNYITQRYNNYDWTVERDGYPWDVCKCCFQTLADISTEEDYAGYVAFCEGQIALKNNKYDDAITSFESAREYKNWKYRVLGVFAAGFACHKKYGTLGNGKQENLKYQTLPIEEKFVGYYDEASKMDVNFPIANRQLGKYCSIKASAWKENPEKYCLYSQCAKNHFEEFLKRSSNESQNENIRNELVKINDSSVKCSNYSSSEK